MVKTVDPYIASTGEDVTFTICIFNGLPSTQVEIEQVRDDINLPFDVGSINGGGGVSSSGQAIRFDSLGPSGPVNWSASGGGNIVLNPGDSVDLTMTVRFKATASRTSICNNPGDYTVTLVDPSVPQSKSSEPACTYIP
jgi:hypothetical protein